jgi:hypothetical protein
MASLLKRRRPQTAGPDLKPDLKTDRSAEHEVFNISLHVINDVYFKTSESDASIQSLIHSMISLSFRACCAVLSSDLGREAKFKNLRAAPLQGTNFQRRLLPLGLWHDCQSLNQLVIL